MVSERSCTALVAPKRLLTASIATSAIGTSVVQRCAECPPRDRIEDRHLVGLETQPHLLALAHMCLRRDAGLHVSTRRRDGDDLGGAKILGAEDLAADRRSVA